MTNEEWLSSESEATYKFGWSFSSPEIVIAYDEYNIYSGIDVTSSVGGTLGLCIGFSFSNVALFLIHFLQKIIKKKNSILSTSIASPEQSFSNNSEYLKNKQHEDENEPNYQELKTKIHEMETQIENILRNQTFNDQQISISRKLLQSENTIYLNSRNCRITPNTAKNSDKNLWYITENI